MTCPRFAVVFDDATECPACASGEQHAHRSRRGHSRQKRYRLRWRAEVNAIRCTGQPCYNRLLRHEYGDWLLFDVDTDGYIDTMADQTFQREYVRVRK